MVRYDEVEWDVVGAVCNVSSCFYFEFNLYSSDTVTTVNILLIIRPAHITYFLLFSSSLPFLFPFYPSLIILSMQSFSSPFSTISLFLFLHSNNYAPPSFSSSLLSLTNLCQPCLWLQWRLQAFLLDSRSRSPSRCSPDVHLAPVIMMGSNDRVSKWERVCVCDVYKEREREK